jgi:hypothetical protein
MENDLFVKLENQISELIQQEENLRVFADFVTTDAFDDEDRNTVRAKHVHITQTKQHLQEVLTKKKDIYNTQIKTMEIRLQQRQLQLEDFGKKTRVFEAFPDVIEYFAKKQARLNESLTGVKEKLVM